MLYEVITPVAEVAKVAPAPAVAAQSWNGKLAQQLNDCYLLTTIRNYSEARAACQAPAQQGDRRAQSNMALISRALGQYAAALDWAQQAAPGSADAAYLLGELYERGQGVEASDQRALSWYLQAAEQGP